MVETWTIISQARTLYKRVCHSAVCMSPKQDTRQDERSPVCMFLGQGKVKTKTRNKTKTKTKAKTKTKTKTRKGKHKIR